ncbi:MAG: mycofactocin system glycosyltransferase [Acidimicrobiaceae bacterium]|nr:mycofactocin system glycosyltransferase [Acidimicrobiaceae bacterium]
MTSEQARRYALDGSVQAWPSTTGLVVVGGSPLKLFRLTPSGAGAFERVRSGEPVVASSLVDRLLDGGVIHPIADGPAPFDAEDVTIVVPTFGPPTHVPSGAVVVDDGSSPPVDGASIRLERNRGPAAARNAGLAATTTPLVAFVDADVELPDGWLEPLLAHFADPRVAVVAPRIVTAPRPGAISAYEHTHGPLDMGPEAARVRAGTRVSYLPAAVLVCRVEAIQELGGFDAEMRYGEDVDLVWRLDDAGWRCRYDPTVVIEHEPRPDWRAWVRQRVGYGSSAGPLAVRHPRKLAPLRMSGWSIAAWVLAAAGRPVTGAAVGVGSAAALIPKLPDVPARDAFRLAAMGNARAGESIAHAVRRTWFPIVLVLALRSRVARRVLLASIVAVRHPLALADDVAYCAGVWTGMLRERTLDPIVPDITSWPGRSARSARRDT